MENKIFFLSLSQTHLLMETNADTIVHSAPQTKYLPYVDYDASGNPIWYTVEEWFNELDKKLITYFGDDFRKMANKRRVRWNQNSDWNFKQL